MNAYDWSFECEKHTTERAIPYDDQLCYVTRRMGVPSTSGKIVERGELVATEPRVASQSALCETACLCKHILRPSSDSVRAEDSDKARHCVSNDHCVRRVFGELRW